MLLEPESMLGVIGGSQSPCCRSQDFWFRTWGLGDCWDGGLGLGLDNNLLKVL